MGCEMVFKITLFCGVKNYSIRHTPNQMESNEGGLERPWGVPCRFGGGGGESEPITDKDESGEASLSQGGQLVLNTCPELPSLMRQRRQARPTVYL